MASHIDPTINIYIKILLKIQSWYKLINKIKDNKEFSTALKGI
jgi:hypothetical protein